MSGKDETAELRRAIEIAAHENRRLRKIAADLLVENEVRREVVSASNGRDKSYAAMLS
jgi:hypothetical protein